MSDLVGNPEDRFSQNEGQVIISQKTKQKKTKILTTTLDYVVTPDELQQYFHVRSDFFAGHKFRFTETYSRAESMETF